MYQGLGSGVLAATGFSVLGYAIGGWVLLIAGLAIMTILPKIRRKDKDDD